MSLVVIIRFRVAAGREQEWEAFIAERSRDLRSLAGLQRVYLLRPDDGGPEYRLVTWWSELERPDAWIRTQAYELSEHPDHKGIVAGATDHEVLRVVQES